MFEGGRRKISEGRKVKEWKKIKSGWKGRCGEEKQRKK
jgi:hypothetical protein